MATQQATTYTPLEGSAAWKVIQFLAANPGEKLDADKISAKCDCDRRSVHTLLGKAVQAGLLKRAEDLEEGELVYSLGEGAVLPGVEPGAGASGFHGWLESKGQSSAEGRPRRSSASAGKSSPPPTHIGGCLTRQEARHALLVRRLGHSDRQGHRHPWPLQGARLDAVAATPGGGRFVPAPLRSQVRYRYGSHGVQGDGSRQGAHQPQGGRRHPCVEG